MLHNSCSLKLKPIIVHRLSENSIRGGLFTDFTRPLYMLKVKVGLIVEFGDFKQTKYELQKIDTVNILFLIHYYVGTFSKLSFFK